MAKVRLQLSPVRPTALMLAIGAFILLLLVGLSHGEWDQYRRANADANRTRDVLSAANGLLSDVLDAETGQRGFVLTGEARYLEPYNHAVQVVPGELTNLGNLLIGRGRPGEAS